MTSPFECTREQLIVEAMQACYWALIDTAHHEAPRLLPGLAIRSTADADGGPRTWASLSPYQLSAAVREVQDLLQSAAWRAGELLTLQEGESAPAPDTVNWEVGRANLDPVWVAEHSSIDPDMHAAVMEIASYALLEIDRDYIDNGLEGPLLHVFEPETGLPRGWSDLGEEARQRAVTAIEQLVAGAGDRLPGILPPPTAAPSATAPWRAEPAEATDTIEQVARYTAHLAAFGAAMAEVRRTADSLEALRPGQISGSHPHAPEQDALDAWPHIERLIDHGLPLMDGIRSTVVVADAFHPFVAPALRRIHHPETVLARLQELRAGWQQAFGDFTGPGAEAALQQAKTLLAQVSLIEAARIDEGSLLRVATHIAPRIGAPSPDREQQIQAALARTGKLLVPAAPPTPSAPSAPAVPRRAR